MGLWGSLPILNGCCICIKLRHGAGLLGIFGLIAALIQIVRLVPDLENHGPTVYQYLSLCFTNVVMSICLLIGVFSKNTLMLAVYLVFILVFIFVLSIVAVERFLEENLHTGFTIVGLILIMFYFWWCIESYYQELKEEEREYKKKFCTLKKKTETLV